ncbi:UvrD-helicase domain-containing protein, partial [Psychrobacter sp. DAB_AL32B]|uniref:UvrD-helicase domain-containing protein n=1 Tax=Psychrobacter sp. DAB_AL32B TaxID=1028414 RepID=UPI00105575D3
MDQYNNAGNGFDDVGHDYSHILPEDLFDNIAGKTANKPEEPPAIRIKLNGKYLIEASAGTGKTWTLTGIVLRLLIEGKRAPEQIIATSFTRAAAAEMRQRINERLTDFYQLLQWFNRLKIDSSLRAILYPPLINESIKKPSDKTDQS